MRKLKFRVWASEDKAMFYSKEDNFTHMRTIGTGPVMEGSLGYMSGGYPVMQWTGLRDAQGRDIYEGDIVETRTGQIRVIVWRKGAFHSQEIGWKENAGMATHPVYFWALTPDLAPRVIGNVHQNHELLTVKR